MRLGVLDVGSNTVNLVVAEADSGLPLPVHTWEQRPRLAHRLPADGTIGPAALQRMIGSVREAVAESRRARVNSRCYGRTVRR